MATMADKEWCDASCAACAGQGSRPGADGFVACAACGGTGKIATRGGCCARGDDHHHGGAPAFGAGGKACDDRVTLEEMMAELDLENARGEPVAAAEAFDNKVVGLYFTGRHCPACARFSPALAAFSEEERAGYVTVVVSGDASADAADAGFAAIVQSAAAAGTRTDSLSPTLRVPFDSPHRRALLRAFRVLAIPALHVWHPAAKKSVTAWGHTAVSFNREKCVAQWHLGQAGWEIGVFDFINPLPRCVSLASFATPPVGVVGKSKAPSRDEKTEEKETTTTPPKAFVA
jgi:thiol-disulfide isomerase/thioredoxin